MMLRDWVKIEFVLPLTDSLGEFRVQVAPLEANEANRGVPGDMISALNGHNLKW